MKRMIILALLLVALLGCEEDPTSPKNSFKFENQTSLTIWIYDDSKGFDDFRLDPYGTVILETKEIIPYFHHDDLVNGNRIYYDYNYDTEYDGAYIFHSFVNEVQYRVTGSCGLADICINNSDGGTEIYGDVELPAVYSYQYFNDWFVYVSAQNQTDSGSIKVEIYYKDNLFKQAESQGAYVIATASGSIGKEGEK